MTFLDSVTIPNTLTRTPRQRTGGFLGGITLPKDPIRATKVFNIQQEAAEARKQAEEIGGLSGILKGTGIDILKRTKTAGLGALTNIFRTFEALPSKINENIQEAAKDLQEGKTIKGVLKAGVRTAGDTAIAIFAPISAAIGAVLELTRSQVLIDKTGEVIADKSGITDIKKFQEFAINHPNAGEDFERLLFLTLAKADKTQIDPKKSIAETRAFVNKLVSSEVKVEPTAPQVKGGFLESVQRPEAPTEAPVRPVGERVTPEAPEVPQKISKVALSVEARAIEQKLADGFEGKAGFDPITIKEQARLVSELIARDVEQAKRMIRGEEPIPDNLRGSSLIVGLEEHALRTGDAALLKDLAKSPLTSETSRSAQELRILAERIPNSPVQVILDVSKAREIALEGRTGGILKRKQKVAQIQKVEVENIRIEIKKSASKRPTWEEFIKEIKCNS